MLKLQLHSWGPVSVYSWELKVIFWPLEMEEFWNKGQGHFIWHTRLELDDSTSEEKTRHYSWDIQVRGGKECKYSHNLLV